MIHHVVYFQLTPEVSAATLEDLVRTSRSQLLKIPEVLSVRSGRNIELDSKWQFFFAIEVESLEKLKTIQENPYHLKLIEKTIKLHTCDQFVLDFELDPSKNLKYS
jgi:Stress responsive A/B Barrel Domain